MDNGRRQQIISQAKNAAKYGPWSDKLRDYMTGGEIRQVTQYWQEMPGNPSWYDAFMSIPHNWESCNGCVHKVGKTCTHPMSMVQTENGPKPGVAIAACMFWEFVEETQVECNQYMWGCPHPQFCETECNGKSYK